MKRVILHAGIFAGLCCVLGAGCGRVSGEQREARDRHLRRAEAAQAAQDIDRAIAWCEKALERRPGLALAHRKLGLMLDNYRQDYVAAIYHYQRYLALRPDATCRPDIEALIRRCRISFAAQLAESPGEFKRDLQARDQRLADLEREVTALREKLRAGARPAAPEPSAFQFQPPAPKAAAAAPVSAPGPVHVVQAGENLAGISTRYYGTPARWKTIFNANRASLSDANNLRVGTRLEIPQE